MKIDGHLAKYYCCFLLGLLLVFMPLNHAMSQTKHNQDFKENIQIIATTNNITIDTNFSGGDIYIAGVLENTAPILLQQKHYDVIVVMEGPKGSIVMREKKRKMGFWVNADSLIFENVPSFYSVVTTREIYDIAKPEILTSLGLGVDYIALKSDEEDREKREYYRHELIALKKQEGLYSQATGAINFGSPALFTAKFHLPANVPVGQHQVKAYLFRDGQLINQVTLLLEIAKAHIAHEIYNAASQYSLLYGLAAVFVAIATGFLGRFIFRKD